jgi:hypothetical protein
MGRKPKAPDMSVQNRLAEAQMATLQKEQATATQKAENTAMENTNKLRGMRRRLGGRISALGQLSSNQTLGG